MRRWICTVIVAMLLVVVSCALAETSAGTVAMTGDVNVRSGPGLDCETLGVVSNGTVLSYAGETSVDDRGVAWYKVDYSGGDPAWVSATYAVLTADENAPASSGANLSVEYSLHLNGDGQAETLRIYPTDEIDEYGDNIQRLMLAASSVDGAPLGEEEIMDSFGMDGAEYRVTAYQIGNGGLYVEARLYWDAVTTHYLLFRLGDGLTKECHVVDPGYTDAAGLEDLMTGNELFYSENLGDADAAHMMPALNSIFEAHGIRFVADGEWFRVDLPDDALICDLTAADIVGN